MSDTLALPSWLTPTLLGLVSLGLVWVLGTLNALVKRFERFDVALFGERGDNGINGTVKQLATRQDDADTKADKRAHAVNNKLHEHETRLTLIERARA